MTTPFERFRALSCFPQMLSQAAADSMLSDHLRERAIKLLGEFPDEQQLLTLIDAGRHGLPRSVAQ